MTSEAGASSTATSCRALVAPSKKIPLPVLVIAARSESADVEGVCEALAHGRARLADGLDPIECRKACQVERLHAEPPDRKLHGRLIDGRIAQHERHIADETKADGNEFG